MTDRPYTCGEEHHASQHHQCAELWVGKEREGGMEGRKEGKWWKERVREESGRDRSREEVKGREGWEK